MRRYITILRLTAANSIYRKGYTGGYFEKDRFQIASEFAAGVVKNPDSIQAKLIESLAKLDEKDWIELEKLFDKNENTVQVESKDNFVYSDIPVALCGVEGLSVVIKNGKALVMKKGTSGFMREVVKQVNDTVFLDLPITQKVYSDSTFIVYV